MPKKEAGGARGRKRRGRGEGGVHFDEDKGRWVASISLGYKTDGRRLRPTVYGDSKAEVVEKVAKLREQHRLAGRDASADAATLTVSEVVKRWLAFNEPKTARRTHENRSEAGGLVVAYFGKTRLAAVKAHHVEGFHAHLAAAVAPSYAWHAARALSAALEYATERDLLARNPAKKVGIPPLPEREMLTLTQAQARTLMEVTAGYSFHPLLVTALATGLRQGELLGLAWDDLDLDGAGTLAVRRSLSHTKAHGFQLKQPKTAAARRTVALPPPAVAVLREYREERRAAGMLRLTAFATEDGTHQSRGKITNHLKRAIKRANARQGAGIPDALRFHDLRHTHASLLLSQGQSLRAVSQRLGHADPALTLRVYAHVMPGDDARLAAAVGAILW